MFEKLYEAEVKNNNERLNDLLRQIQQQRPTEAGIIEMATGECQEGTTVDEECGNILSAEV